ncbi:GntR family transcriptional regulator [Nonomuraea mangrovi]|uniref:GntR family transcriptional regulator n=1 Tax=Nonomuraea mangrovi TaxID=2316207 RepID=A0ABW4SXH6_9ACTN
MSTIGADQRLTKTDQLREHLSTLVGERLRPGDRLPTERELADEFGVSRLTVRRALDRLESERLVYRVQGAGTFASRRPITKTIEFTSFSEDMRSRGLSPGSRLLDAVETPAGARIGYALAISPADPVFRVRRVRTADDAPMCLETSHVPLALAPGLLDLPLEGSLYSLLETRFRIRLVRADQVIRATVLDPEEAELLQAMPLSPALLVERTAYDQRGRAVEVAKSLYRGDRYSYEIAIERTS